MKIRKVIDLCKKAGVLRLYVHEKERWISDGWALYPLWGMPELTLDGLRIAYDIPDKKWEEMQVTYNPEGIPATINTADIDDYEVKAVRAPLWIRWGGQSLVPFAVSTGVAWLDAAYLTPFEKGDQLDFFERRSPDGRLYFAVKVGFELVGILFPENLPHKELTVDLEILARQCRLSLENEQKEAAEAEVEQMEMEGT